MSHEKIKINEVREHLARYLSEAEKGEEIIITKHSRPVARLMPLETGKESEFPDLTDFRNSIEMKGKPVSQVVTDMRKEERY